MVTRFDDFVRGLLAQANQTARRVRAQPPVAQMADLLVAALGASAAAGGPPVGAAPPAAADPAAAPDPAAILGELAKVPLPTPGQRLPPQAFVDLRPPPDVSLAEMQRQAAEALAPAERSFVPMDPAVVSLVIDQQFAEAGQTPTTAMREIAPESQPGFIPEVPAEEGLPPHLVEARPQREEAERRTPTVAPPIVERPAGAWDDDIRARVAQGGLEQADDVRGVIEQTLALDGLDPTLRQSLAGTRTALIEQSHKLQEMRRNPWQYSPQEVSLEADLTETYAELAKIYAAIARAEGRERERLIQAAHELGAAITETRRLLDAYRAPDGDERAQAEIAQARQAFLEMAEQYPEVEREYDKRLADYLDAQRRYADAQAAAAQDPANQGLRQTAMQAEYDLLKAERDLMSAEEQLQMMADAGVPEYLWQRDDPMSQLLGPLAPVFNALDWLRRKNVARQGELAYRHATGQGPAVSSFELEDIGSLQGLAGALFEQVVDAVSKFPEWANDPKNRELIKQVYEQGYWSEDGQFFRGGAAVWEYYIGQQPWYRRAIEDLVNDPLNWASVVAVPTAGGLRAMAAGVQATNPRLARALRVAARLTEVATDPTAPITDRPISAAVVALRDRVLRRLPGVSRALAPTDEAVFTQTRATAEDALAFLRQQEEAVMAAAPEPGLGPAGTTSAMPSTAPATTASAPGVTGGPATATTPASAVPAEAAQPTTAPGTTSAGMTAPAGTTTATSPTTTPAAPEPRVTKTKTGRAIQVGDERATISRTAGGEYAIRIDRRVVERVGTEQEALERATDLLTDRWRAKQPVTATPAIPAATPADPFAGTALARDRAPVIGGQPVTVEMVGDRAYRILAPGDELRAYWDERAQRFAVTRERDGISQLLGTARTEAEVADLVLRELERRASAAAPLEAPDPLVEAAEAEVAAPAPEPAVRVTELEAPGARRRYQARGQEVIDTETGQRVAQAPSPEAARQEAARRNLMERPAVLVEAPESAQTPPRTGEATEAVAPEPASRDVAPRTEATEAGAPTRTEAGNLVEQIGENQYRVSDRFTQVYVFADDRDRWHVTSEPPDQAPKRLLGRQTLEEALRHADTRLSEARKSLEPPLIRRPRTFHVSPAPRWGYAVYEVIGNRWERISSRYRTQEAAEAAAARWRDAEVRRVEQAVAPILSPDDPTAGPTTLDLDDMMTYTRLWLPDGQEVRIEANAGVGRDDPFWTVSTRDNLLGEYLTYDEAYRLATERLGARVEGAPGAVPESPAPGMRTVRTEAGDQGVLPGLGDAARPVFGEPATGRLEAPTGGPAEPLRLEVQVLETPEAQREAQRLAGQQELPLGEPAPEPVSGWETVPRVEVAPDEAPYAVVRRIEPAWVDAGNGMVRGRVIIGGRRFETATAQNPATTDLAAVTRSGRAWVEVDPTGAPIGPRASLEVHVARVQAEPMPATAAQDADTLAGAPPAPSQAPGREVAASEAAPARPRASELAPGWTERSPSGYPMVRLAENAHLIVGEQSRVIVEPSGDAWAITGVTDSGLRSPQGTAPTRDAAVAQAEDYLRTVDSTERLASDLPTAPTYEVRQRRRGRAVVYDLYQRDGLKPIHTFRSRAEAEQVISELYDIQSRMAAPGAYREDVAPAPATAAPPSSAAPEPFADPRNPRDIAPGWTQRTPRGYPAVQIDATSFYITDGHARVVVTQEGDRWIVREIRGDGPQVISEAGNADEAFDIAERTIARNATTLGDQPPIVPQYSSHLEPRSYLQEGGERRFYNRYVIRDQSVEIAERGGDQEAVSRVIRDLNDLHQRIANPEPYRAALAGDLGEPTYVVREERGRRGRPGPKYVYEQYPNGQSFEVAGPFSLLRDAQAEAERLTHLRARMRESATAGVPRSRRGGELAPGWPDTSPAGYPIVRTKRMGGDETLLIISDRARVRIDQRGAFWSVMSINRTGLVNIGAVRTPDEALAIADRYIAEQNAQPRLVSDLPASLGYELRERVRQPRRRFAEPEVEYELWERGGSEPILSFADRETAYAAMDQLNDLERRMFAPREDAAPAPATAAEAVDTPPAAPEPTPESRPAPQEAEASLFANQPYQRRVVDLAQIRTRPDFQPRQALDQERVDELVQTWDFRRYEPIKLWRAPDGQLYVMAGHHRLAAMSRLAETDPMFRNVDAFVYEGLSEQEARDLALASNTQTAGMAPSELARLVHRELARGLPPTEQSFRMIRRQHRHFRTVGEVKRAYRIGLLPRELQDLVDGGTLPANIADHLARGIEQGIIDEAEASVVYRRYVVGKDYSATDLDHLFAAMRRAKERVPTAQLGLFGERVGGDLAQIETQLDALRQQRRQLEQIRRAATTTIRQADALGLSEAARGEIAEGAEQVIARIHDIERQLFGAERTTVPKVIAELAEKVRKQASRAKVEVRADPDPVGPVRGADPIPPPDGQPWVRATDASETVVRSGDRTVVIQRTPDGFRVVDSDAPDATVETLDAAMALLADRGVLSGSRIQTGSAITVVEHGPTIDLSIDGLTVRVRERNGRWVIEGTGPNGEALVLREGIADRGVALREAEGELIGAYAERVRRGKARLSERATKTGRTWTIAGERRYGPTRLTVRSVRRGGEDVWEFVTDTGQRAIIPRADLSEASLDAVAERVLRDPMGDGQGRLNPDLVAERATIDLADQRIVTAETPAQPEAQSLADDLGLLTQQEDATPTVRTEEDERAGYAWYLNPERVVWLRELERVRPGIWEEKIKPRLLEWLKGPEARLFKRYFGEPTHEEARARLRRLGVPEARIRELTDPTQELERRLEQRFGTAPMDGPIAEAMYAAVIKQVADEEGIQLSVFSGKAFWTDPSYLTPHGGDGVLESWRVGRYNPDGDATWVWRLIWTPDENAAVATHARRLMYQHGLIDRDAYHGAAKPFDREAATARARRGDVTWERTDRGRRRVTVKDLRRQLGSDEAAVRRWVEIEERRYVEAVRRAEAIRQIRQVLHGGERPVSVAPREGPFVVGDPVDAPTQVRKRLYPVYDQRGYVVATASSREEAERIAATLSESYWLIPNERKRELGELFPSLREEAGGRGRPRGDANLYLVHPAVARFLRHSLRHAPTLSNPNPRFLDLLPPDVEEVLQWRFQGVVDPELRGLTLAEVAVDFGLEAQTHQRLYQKLHALGVRPEHYRGSRPPTLRLRRKPKPGVSDPDLALLGGSYEETMAALHNLYARFGLDIMNDAPALLGDVRAAYAIARDRAPNAGRQLPLVLDLVHALLFRAPIHLAIATPFNLAYDIRNMLSNITAHTITMRGLDRIINVPDWWKAFRDVPSNVDRLTEELGIGLPALLRTPESQRRPLVGGIGVGGDIITAGRETPTRRLSQRLRVTEPVAQAFDWKRELSGRLELASRRASYATLLSAEVTVRKGQFIDEMTAQVQRFLPGITEDDIELVVLNLTSDLGAFSPHLAYQGFYDFAISKGLSHDVAENLGDQAYRRWAGMVRQASQRSLERLNQIYPHRITETKLDRFLQHIVFFHFWPSRMMVFMLDEMFRDPRLAVNVMRAYQSIMRESEQDADLRHGSVRTAWFTKLLGLGQTPFGLFFMADLRTLFLVSELLPQVREDRELPNTTLAYKEMERWSRRLGGIGLTPFTYGALNALGVFGDAPIRPIWNSRELQLAGAVADWLLTETGHDRGSPVYRQFYQNFREKLSGLIPGTVHVPADEAGGSLEDLIRSQIIADNPDLRAKLESASETIRLEGLAEVERILENPRDPRYQRAELAVVRSGAAQRLLNLIVPFSLSFSVPGRQETIRLARLGREGVTLPAAQAAVDERLAATASPELLSLRVQQRQLQRVGTPEQRTAVDMYRRIRNGELTGTITIGGSSFTAEQVRQAPQEVRDFLATYWAMEHGLQDEIDAYYASREEMLASPEFAEYRAYLDWSRQMRERGIAQAREELMRISPNYRRYIESLPEEVRADPEALDAASVSVRAYLAQKGIATSVYDRPAAATDVSQVPASTFVLGQTGEERGQRQERSEQSAGERFLRDLARYQEDLAAANVVLQRLTGQPGLTFDQLDPLSRQAFEYHVARFGVRVPSKPASVEQYERWAAERRKQGLPADALTYALLLDQTGEQPASEVFGSDLASLLQLASGPMLDPATILMLQQLGLAPSGGLANLPDYYGGSQRDPFAGTAIARPIVGYGASGPPADVLGISIRDPFLGTRYGR